MLSLNFLKKLAKTIDVFLNFFLKLSFWIENFNQKLFTQVVPNDWLLNIIC